MGKEKRIIVFLDIDGVVATREALRKKWEEYAGTSINADVRPILEEYQLAFPNVSMYDWPFCPKACANIHKFQRSFLGYKVVYVISSTWRKAFGGDLEELNQVFTYKGLLLNEIIGKTDNFGARGEEILKWIEDNNEQGTPYIVIDDECKYDIFEHVSKDNCVETTFNKGFDGHRLKEAINKVYEQL